MWAKVLEISASPRKVLRRVLSLDDSPHAIALGVAIGMFFGLTPTVGLQTVMILAFLAVTRRFFRFNPAAAMAATYVSNPITMVPLYYFWYKLGAIFIGGNATIEQFEALVEFEGMSGWLEAVKTVGIEIGAPMLLGSLITAPIGAAIAYPAVYSLLTWIGRKPDTGLPQELNADTALPEERASGDDSAEEDEESSTHCLTA